MGRGGNNQCPHLGVAATSRTAHVLGLASCLQRLESPANGAGIQLGVLGYLVHLGWSDGGEGSTDPVQLRVFLQRFEIAAGGVGVLSEVGNQLLRPLSP
jgi:hypothetical protein